MRIGVIGAGRIGGTLARKWVAVGHEVWIANSRGPASLAQMAREVPGITPATVADAAREGQVVLLAVPWAKPEALRGNPTSSREKSSSTLLTTTRATASCSTWGVPPPVRKWLAVCQARK